MTTNFRRALASTQKSCCISHYLRQVSDLLSLQTFKTPSLIQLMNSPHSSLRKEQQSDGNSLNFLPPILLTYLYPHSYSLSFSYYNGKKSFPVPKSLRPTTLTFWILSPLPIFKKFKPAIILWLSMYHQTLCLLNHPNKHKHTNYPFKKPLL